MLLSLFLQLALEPQDAQSQILSQVRVDQRLGETVPLDLRFRGEDGAEVRLGDCFRDRPVLLALVYYECPSLCSMVLNGLVDGLREVGFTPGADFEVVIASIDPGETPELAAAKKQAYLGRYGRPETAAGWHFLTGTQDPIARLADAAGFRYVYDASTDQYAHGAVIYTLTPAGVLSRYLFGVDYPPRDLRLALVEASEGRIGTLADAVLLRCYHYDPESGRYGFAIFTALRVGAAVTLLGLAALIFLLLRRERRARAAAA
ncbi:MAG: SCO family protein [Planctomycetota bacterium]|nr:MAG: SCO family protein [Planctomycetota bacterium]